MLTGYNSTRQDQYVQRVRRARQEIMATPRQAAADYLEFDTPVVSVSRPLGVLST